MKKVFIFALLALSGCTLFKAPSPAPVQVAPKIALKQYTKPQQHEIITERYKLEHGHSAQLVGCSHDVEPPALSNCRDFTRVAAIWRF